MYRYYAFNCCITPIMSFISTNPMGCNCTDCTTCRYAHAYKVCCNDTNTLFEEKSFAFGSNIRL
uniref:Uncharacterized protein n=1 Tax=Romanomermis culicivorax TaxID=13658 RepID=A0A915I1V8_ROMCU